MLRILQTRDISNGLCARAKRMSKNPEKYIGASYRGNLYVYFWPALACLFVEIKLCGLFCWLATQRS